MNDGEAPDNVAVCKLWWSTAITSLAFCLVAGGEAFARNVVETCETEGEREITRRLIDAVMPLVPNAAGELVAEMKGAGQ